MATDDIVQNVEIGGEDQVNATFNRMASSGEKAFSAISNAADKATKSLGGVERVSSSVGLYFSRVSTAAAALGTNASNVATRISRIGGSITVLGGVVAIAASRMYNSLEKLKKSQAEERSELAQNRQEQQETLAAELQHKQSLADLGRQFASGKLDITAYTQQLTELNIKNREQVAMQKKLRAAQREAAAEQAREQASLKVSAAMREMEDKLGQRLTQSMLRLGGVVDNVRKSFVAAFGPQLASIVDSLSTAIQRNAPAIQKAFASAAAALAPIIRLVIDNLSSIISMLTSFATAVASVVMGVVIPAFQGLMTVLGLVASAINNVFGTNFTAQQLLVFAVLLKIIGAFKLLASVIFLVMRVLTPMGLLITVIGAALIALPWQEMGKTALGVWASITQALAGVQQYLTDLWTSITTGAANAWAALKDAAVNALSAVMAPLNALIEKLKEAWGWVQKLFSGSKPGAGASSGGSGGSTPAFAGGGNVRGPGTGTSDSIPAWLSNGEYVIRAKSVAEGVRRYGRGFWAMLNNLDRGGAAFASGGLAGSVAPALARAPIRRATGGSVTAPRRLDLVLDGQRFSGLSAPGDTAADLERYAARKRLASAGKRPSWEGKR